MTSLWLSLIVLVAPGVKPEVAFTLPMQVFADLDTLPVEETIGAGTWQESASREILLPHRDDVYVFDLSALVLAKGESWALRLNHRRVGFELWGYSTRLGSWQPVEVRAEVPLGVVLSVEQLRPFRYLAIRNTGVALGLLNLVKVEHRNVVDLVNSYGTLQLLAFGCFAFLVIASTLLFVFFGRRVYIWYFSFLLGGWLVVWIASPGNPTIPNWVRPWMPIVPLGIVASSLGYLGVIRATYLTEHHRKIRWFLDKSIRILLIVGGVGLVVAPQMSELTAGILMQIVTLFIAPYLVFKGSRDRMALRVWLVGAIGSNLLGGVVGVMELSGGGLSAYGTTIGLLSIVLLHFILLGIFVFEDFRNQRSEMNRLRRLVDDEARHLHERQEAIAFASANLASERAAQATLGSERRLAQERLDSVTENLRSAFEQMIESRRYATLGGFWPQFSSALRGGMDRLITLRRELGPVLERSAQLGLVERMDTALQSCRDMAQAVEGALEFEGDTTSDLARVTRMAVTLLGWTEDDPTLQLRIEKGIVVPGAHAEWLQLTMNLLSNSRKALKKSSGDGQGRVVFQARRVEKGTEIVVEDSGPGWPAELLRVRLTDILDEPQRRSGLGLAICATICKRHSATMTLRASSLGGAAVIIVAPPATAT